MESQQKGIKLDLIFSKSVNEAKFTKHIS